LRTLWQGNPYEPYYRVGAFSHFDAISTTRRITVNTPPSYGYSSTLRSTFATEEAIKSVDDTAETYVPGSKGSEYGRTTIRDLLHMSSGVEFREDQDGARDLNLLWKDMVRGWGIGKSSSSARRRDGKPVRIVPYDMV
jgi:hypothetical protein